MRPLLVLFLSPVACGLVSMLLFRSVRVASFAATVSAPLLIFVLVKLSDPDEPWSAFATFLVSPLVIALAVITVFLCSGRTHVRGRRRWHDGREENAGV